MRSRRTGHPRNGEAIRVEHRRDAQPPFMVTAFCRWWKDTAVVRGLPTLEAAHHAAAVLRFPIAWAITDSLGHLLEESTAATGSASQARSPRGSAPAAGPARGWA